MPPMWAVVAVAVSGFVLLLCLCMAALLALGRINPDLYDRIDNFLFGPPDHS